MKYGEQFEKESVPQWSLRRSNCLTVGDQMTSEWLSLMFIASVL